MQTKTATYSVFKANPYQHYGYFTIVRPAGDRGHTKSHMEAIRRACEKQRVATHRDLGDIRTTLKGACELCGANDYDCSGEDDLTCPTCGYVLGSTVTLCLPSGEVLELAEKEARVAWLRWVAGTTLAGEETGQVTNEDGDLLGWYDPRGEFHSERVAA